MDICVDREGNLVGFRDLGSFSKELAKLELTANKSNSEDEQMTSNVATHVLCFMVLQVFFTLQ